MAMSRWGRFRAQRDRVRAGLTPAFARELRGTLVRVQWATSVTILVALLGSVLVAGLTVGP